MSISYQCIDALSPYCPCYLAENQSCIICSILRGKDTCDCIWQGSCIYQEYIWNGKRKKEPRKVIEAKIKEKKKVTKNLLVYKVSLSLPLSSIDYSQPGTYVFLRSANSQYYFEVPLCVMDVDEDENTLTFAVQIIGPKTKNLAQEDNTLLLRGPYYNGIFGLKHIKSTKNKKCLLIGGGIGQASLVLVAKALHRGGNDITALLDPGAINYNLAMDYLNSLNAEVRIFNRYDSLFESLLQQVIEDKGIEMVYSGGSDLQHNLVKSAVMRSRRKIALSFSNNAKLCCGEGICGSCEVSIGVEKFKLCKIQTEYQMLGR
ncbi:MAG: sulfide/dihydroorotate dehydrogenase-like FAD/NAD-binding protein [Thermosediminibacteraceae bacterium]|nr:sulfide/dihydroorotate dehydrogenase-like FAD/NAD-binding protein [Thermosediminibacteraceae bacterium]